MPKKTPQKNTAKKKNVAPIVAPSPRRKSGKGRKPQLLRGMRDILPQEQHFWEYVTESSLQGSRAYGYDRVDVPVIEDVGLYMRTTGEDSDIVQKEMYEFETHGEDRVALRPEFTPGVARMYIEHGMMNLPKPVKLWTFGPVFRYDRPQSGRYRQFHQVSWEVLGSEKPAIDAELIFLGSHLLMDMGLAVVALVNSIGCRDCRPGYINALKEYFRPHRKQLCENCQRRYLKNPLRLLDCKEEHCRAIGNEAPQSVDHLCQTCKEHFMGVLEYLDEADVPYHLQPRLVRGLDYYSRTVFEFILEREREEPSPNALLSGGRYDYLVNDLGGPETPAAGMAMGMERVIIAMKEAAVPISPPPHPDVFFAQIGETARKASFKIFESLRKSGIAVAANITKNGLSDQLSLAAKGEARVTLILGQKEMIDNTIIVRDMDTGSQEAVAQDRLVETVKRIIKK